MHKETSPGVSSIASRHMNISAGYIGGLTPEGHIDLARDVRTLAASALGQDEHTGQEPETFYDRLIREKQELETRLTKLTNYLGTGAAGVNDERRELLDIQSLAMTVYLRALILHLRATPAPDKSQHKLPLASIGEPVQTGGHDHVRDGDPDFDS